MFRECLLFKHTARVDIAFQICHTDLEIVMQIPAFPTFTARVRTLLRERTRPAPTTWRVSQWLLSTCLMPLKRTIVT